MLRNLESVMYVHGFKKFPSSASTEGKQQNKELIKLRSGSSDYKAYALNTRLPKSCLNDKR